MARNLQIEIEEFKKRLYTLSAHVEENLSKAVKALSDRNEDLAKEVITNDKFIDLYEVEVEEEGLKILALHQPVAIDLRIVIAMLKINNDLERIGDLAVSIADKSVYLLKNSPVNAPFDFETMSEKTKMMLHQSIDSLVEQDAEKAEAVCKVDDQIDEIHSQVFATVNQAILAKPENAEVLISYLSISKNLERIADYATNIAEDVIYIVTGKITRHSQLLNEIIKK
jgi:phosphate transport system protein